MAWRRAKVAFGLLGLLVGVGVWLGYGPRTSRSGSGHAAMPARSLRSAEIVVPFAWLGQRGVEGRRIAGRVIHAGQPVPNAAVRLTTEPLGVGEWTLAEVEADDAGRFDLGVRLATRYVVVGQAEGLGAAGVTVDLRAPDPRPAPDAITIELRSCNLVISGTVQDAGGGIIRGARVRAGTYASEFGVTRSDEQGRYRLCLSAGPAHLEASAEAYATQLKDTRGAGERRIDFELVPESELAGRVVDSDGGPVAGAVVTAATYDHEAGAVTESDAEGRFRLDGLAGGNYLLVARADDRAAEQSVSLGSGRATADILLTIQPRFPFTGRVVTGGHPTGGVTVTVTNFGSERELGTAVSQADGRFAITGLPARKVRVGVTGHKLVSPAATIDLALVHDVEIVCDRLATVSGRVHRDRAPVGRAEVVLYEQQMRRHRVLTRDDGTFSIDGVAVGSYEIAAQREALAAVPHRQPLQVGATDVANVVLELDVSASIAGTVVDPTGAGVGGMLVEFASRTADVASDVTGADGTFLVTGVAGEADYQARVTSTGEMPYQQTPGREWPLVHVAGATSQITGVRIVMTPGNLTISGRVTRGGAPVAGAGIGTWSRSGGRHTQSGPDGTFQLEKLFPGMYHVFAGGPEGIGTEREIAAGSKDVRIELPDVGTIEGTLRGFSGPTRVALSPLGGGRSYEARANQTTFSLKVPPGTYVANAQAQDGGYGTTRVTAVADNTSRVTLEALPRGRITGVVTDWKTGGPIAGATCGWSAENGASAIPVPSDASGHFAFDAPPRKVSVSCGATHAQSHLARIVTVDLQGGALVDVAVELILTGGKHPVPSVWLEETAPNVLQVDDLGTAGRAAGLHIGDVIKAVDGRSVAGLSLEATSYLIFDHDAATPARLTVERNGASLTFVVPPEGSLDRR